MPRKTDSKNPADWLTDRYPGFDLDDPDWQALREEVRQVSALLTEVQSRVTAK